MRCDYCDYGIDFDNTLYYVYEIDGTENVCCADCLPEVADSGMVVDVEDSYGDLVRFWEMALIFKV